MRRLGFQAPCERTPKCVMAAYNRRMTAIRKATTIRLSPQGRAIREALSARLGIDGTAIIELALRRLAAIEGIDPATIKPQAAPAAPKPKPTRNARTATKTTRMA